MVNEFVIDNTIQPKLIRLYKSGSHERRYFYQQVDHPAYSLVYTLMNSALLITQGQKVMKRIIGKSCN